jgi:hypothetical protein
MTLRNGSTRLTVVLVPAMLALLSAAGRAQDSSRRFRPTGSTMTNGT